MNFKVLMTSGFFMFFMACSHSPKMESGISRTVSSHSFTAEPFTSFLDRLATDTSHPKLQEQAKMAQEPAQWNDENWSQNYFKIVAMYLRAIQGSPTVDGINLNQLEQDLKFLVNLDTFNAEGKDSKNPNFKKIGVFLHDFADAHGLNFYNPPYTDPKNKSDVSADRIFILELPGENAKEPLAVYMHSDVVSASRETWGITQRGDLNPFELTFKNDSEINASERKSTLETELKKLQRQLQKKDGDPATLSQQILETQKKIFSLTGSRFYGRGVIDDKAAIISSLYSLAGLSQLQGQGYLPKLKRSIHLIIETTEETDGIGVDAYIPWAKDRGINLEDQLSVGLDSNYPVTIAEKGIGRGYLRFPKTGPARKKGEAEIVEMHGMDQSKDQPDNSVVGVMNVWLKVDQPAVFANQLSHELSSFQPVLHDLWAKSWVRDLEYLEQKPEVTIEGDRVRLKFFGRTKVSFDVHDSSSALVRTFAFLNHLADQGKIPLTQNNYLNVARKLWSKFGFDFTGAPLHLAYWDPYDFNGKKVTHPQTEGFMGRLTVALTAFKDHEGQIEQVIDFRLPRGPEGSSKSELEKTSAHMKSLATPRLEQFAQGLGGKAEYELMDSPRYISPDTPYVKRLLRIFQETTGQEVKPVAMSGATTASYRLGGVNFGPTMPNEEDVYHVDNEYKKIENIYLDLQMFSHLFLDLAQTTGKQN